MRVILDIPDEIAAQLKAYSQDVSKTALEPWPSMVTVAGC